MYVYGKNILFEIVESNYPIEHVYLSDNRQKIKKREFKEIIEMLEKKNISFTFVKDNVLNSMSKNAKHQGIVIKIPDYNYYDISFVENLSSPINLIILDQIQDPHNFGAIIRTAVASGSGAIIIPKHNSVKVTPAVVKVSVGLIFKIPIIQVVNLSDAIEYLKGLDFWIYASHMQGKSFYEIKYSEKSAFIFGNEGEGIRKKLIEKSDELISIPMENNVDSLNVSVSAGIILYDFYVRKKLNTDGDAK